MGRLSRGSRCLLCGGREERVQAEGAAQPGLGHAVQGSSVAHSLWLQRGTWCMQMRAGSDDCEQATGPGLLKNGWIKLSVSRKGRCLRRGSDLVWEQPCWDRGLARQAYKPWRGGDDIPIFRVSSPPSKLREKSHST